MHKKVDLLKAEENGMVAMILPGLRRIGAIRNRIAHRLQVELTKEDEDLLDCSKPCARNMGAIIWRIQRLR